MWPRLAWSSLEFCDPRAPAIAAALLAEGPDRPVFSCPHPRGLWHPSVGDFFAAETAAERERIVAWALAFSDTFGGACTTPVDTVRTVLENSAERERTYIELSKLGLMAKHRYDEVVPLAPEEPMFYELCMVHLELMRVLGRRKVWVVACTTEGMPLSATRPFPTLGHLLSHLTCCGVLQTTVVYAVESVGDWVPVFVQVVAPLKRLAPNTKAKNAWKALMRACSRVRRGEAHNVDTELGAALKVASPGTQLDPRFLQLFRAPHRAARFGTVPITHEELGLYALFNGYHIIN